MRCAKDAHLRILDRQRTNTFAADTLAPEAVSKCEWLGRRKGYRIFCDCRGDQLVKSLNLVESHGQTQELGV